MGALRRSVTQRREDAKKINDQTNSSVVFLCVFAPLRDTSSLSPREHHIPDPEQHLQLFHWHLGWANAEVVAEPELGLPSFRVLDLHINDTRALLALEDLANPIHAILSMLPHSHLPDHSLR